MVCVCVRSCQVIPDCFETRPSCPSPSPRACPVSCPLNWWCHPTILSSVTLFSCLKSFPGSFPMSWLFTSGGQSVWTSASASVLTISIQRWLPLGSTDLISYLSKGFSRVFSSTTVQKHQFFGAQLSLYSHIHTWLLEKKVALTKQTFVGKVMSLNFNMLSRLIMLLEKPICRSGSNS